MKITKKVRQNRADKILRYLKEEYSKPETELNYNNQFQCLVAVMLSAQCTDALVNRVTVDLFKKYVTVSDFATAELNDVKELIKSVSFFNNKAKNIITSAKYVQDNFDGELPKTVEEMIQLSGVAYKTANVVLGEVYDIWEGIATDTHVRRFALRFELIDPKKGGGVRTDLTKISTELEELFPKEDWKYVNNGLVLYGRYICPARPHDCSEHPLTKLIPSANTIWPKSK